MRIGDKFIDPKLRDFNSFGKYIEHINDSRDECDKRGYHRVMQDLKDPLICYDCELFFDRQFAKSCGIKYKVENPF